MKVILCGVLALCISSLAGAKALVDPALKSMVPGSTEQVIFLVEHQPNQGQVPRRYDRFGVYRYLKATAQRNVEPIVRSLQASQLQGVKVRQVFWINSSVLAEVTYEGLRTLAEHPSVTKIYRNGKIRQETMADYTPVAYPADGQLEYSITSIGLDQLYKEMPNVNGQGSMIGVVDTGVDGSHPALQGRVVAFYNGKTKGPSEPKDFDSHGTHVCGTIAGGNRTDTWIGMAPAAKLAVAGALQSYDMMLAGMQWFIDMERNPVVAAKVKAVSNSWNSGGAPDQELFYKAIQAWEAVGILPVFSAGNGGTSGITNPHEHPMTFTVAAYGKDGKVASFSSRGPGKYKGTETMKPEVSGPGVDVLSSVPGGRFARYSGTSMSTPHVSGTIALMLQVNPQLNPAQIRDLLIKTTKVPPGVRLGTWTREYGYGKLDLYKVVKAAAGLFRHSQLMLTSGFDFSNALKSEVADEESQDLGLDSI